MGFRVDKCKVVGLAEGICMMKGLLAYLFGGLLFSSGLAEVGLVVILAGMISHWKYWSAGIFALFVGVYST